ncbi:MAG: hypothetical protein ACYCQJ_16170 [Nitrososphaerales archaeon]
MEWETLTSNQVKCLTCQAPIYIKKNDQGKWDKFNDPEFKVPHVEKSSSSSFKPMRAQKRLTQFASYSVTVSLEDGRSETYTLTKESFVDEISSEDALKFVTNCVRNQAPLGNYARTTVKKP